MQPTANRLRLVTIVVAYSIFAAILVLPVPTTVIRDIAIVTPGSNIVVERQDVYFNGKITAIEPAQPKPKNSRLVEINGTGKYLIPGLWDMHVHLFDEKSLGLFSAHGVTGIRVMFGYSSHLNWRKNVESGKTLGPRMLLGSPIVDGPKPVWPGSITVSNDSEAKAAVKKVKSDGYDFVKVYSLLSRDSFYAIAQEAKTHDIPFAGHIPHSIGILEAQTLGQRTAEHVLGTAVECSDHPSEYRHTIGTAAQGGIDPASKASRALADKIVASYSLNRESELIAGLANGTMFQCPTLVVLRNIAYLDQPDLARADQLKFVHPILREQWNPQNDFRFNKRSESDWKKAKEVHASTLKFVQKMISSNVKFLAGTDALNPYVYAGYSLHEELQLLVQAGMSPTEALATATINPAKLQPIKNQTGLIQVNSLADMVILTANPLEKIQNTLKIDSVIQRGQHLNAVMLKKALNDREYPVAD